jgi:hypothetical protein
MIDTKSPGPLSRRIEEPKPEQVQPTSQGQGNGAPRPLQHPKPGRMPLFRR